MFFLFTGYFFHCHDCAFHFVGGCLSPRAYARVSQGEEWVVERFGRYQRTLVPGLSVIIPLFDRVAYRGDNERHCFGY